MESLVEMSPEALDNVQERTQPAAVVTGILSPLKKEFKSEKDAGKRKYALRGKCCCIQRTSSTDDIR